MSALTYESLGVEVPEFQTPPPAMITYVWWSWHPRYPRWSKSCWKGHSVEEAYKALESKFAHKMAYYHNKLIREDGSTLTEVADEPCKELEAWKKVLDFDATCENCDNGEGAGLCHRCQDFDHFRQKE